MVKDEVRRFLQTQNSFSPLECSALLDLVPAEKTVAAFAWCGVNFGVSFLSSNFKKIFGYHPEAFTEEGVDFVISRVHPDDLSSYLQFMETLHLKAISWFRFREKGIFEHVYRLKHNDGRWLWLRQRLVVLSLTAEGLLDKVLISFTDITEWKAKLEEEKISVLASQTKKSKLVEALVKYKKIQEEKTSSFITEEQVLTAREKQVLELVSKGYSSKQIAHHLFISRHTVESHRKHLLRKLNVSNAAELVQKATFSPLN